MYEKNEGIGTNSVCAGQSTLEKARVYGKTRFSKRPKMRRLGPRMPTVSKPLRNPTAGAREVDLESLCEPHVLWMTTGKRLRCFA